MRAGFAVARLSRNEAGWSERATVKRDCALEIQYIFDPTWGASECAIAPLCVAIADDRVLFPMQPFQAFRSAGTSVGTERDSRSEIWCIIGEFSVMETQLGDAHHLRS